MADLRERAQELWGQLAPWQRFVGVGVILSIIGLLVVLGLWMQEPTYGTLYRDLSERDAAAIVNELEAQGIPYRLSPDGGTIETPADQIPAARLKLAAKNLPQGGTGYELFDQGGLGGALGMTEFMQEMTRQRALEGELARSIMTIEGVEAARVHLALPEKSLFAEQQQPPTASVVLKTAPGVRLSTNQVQAVRFLIANSVEGLEPVNISIVDVEGNLYDAPLVDEEAKLAVATANQIQAESQFEAQTQRDLQAMLTQVLGPNKAVVRVNVEMNWDAEEIESTEVAPEGQVGSVARSTQQEEESWTGAAGAAAAGVPGVDSNAPVDAPTYPEGESSTGDYQRRKIVTEYEVSSMKVRRVKRPGSV
ncbi:MAG: flagellar M-ring protein FliF, partial [Caldilineae bacterium]